MDFLCLLLALAATIDGRSHRVADVLDVSVINYRVVVALHQSTLYILCDPGEGFLAASRWYRVENTNWMSFAGMFPEFCGDGHDPPPKPGPHLFRFQLKIKEGQPRVAILMPTWVLVGVSRAIP